MSCESEAMLRALVNGELDGIAFERATHHLAECERCQAVAERLDGAWAQLRAGYSGREAPERLRLSVRMATRRSEPAPSKRRWPWAVAAAGLAAALALGLFGFARGPSEQMPPLTLEQLALREHQATLDGARAELQVSDPKALQAMLGDDLSVPARLPEALLPGVSLKGARRVRVAGRSGAVLMFERQGRPVSLTVAPRGVVPSSVSARAVDFRGLTFGLSQAGANQVVHWSEGGLDYALVFERELSHAQACEVCHGAGTGLAGVESFRPDT